jgi:exonuclease SbcC
MGYEKVDVDISGYSSIEVVGRNGSGKSALLEMVIYALYGITRLATKEISRKQGDGTHEVIISFDNVAGNKGILEITRGLNAKGNGYASATFNGEPVADGSTELATYIDNTIQMDSVMYLSSVFFGLSDEKKGDKMISVTPATRLENHQILANIAMYKPWKKKVDIEKKKAESEYDVVSGNVEAYEKILADIDVTEINKQIEDDRKEVEKIQEKIDGFKLNDLRAKIEREKTLADNIEELKRSIKEKKEFLSKKVKSIEEYKEDMDEAVENIKTYTSELKELNTQREEQGDLPAFENKKVNITQAIAVMESDLELREAAVQVEHDSCDCPLCKSKVSETVVKKWREEIQTLLDKVAAHNNQLKGIETKIALINTTDAKITRKTSAIDNAKTERDSAKKSIEGFEVERKEIEAKIRDKENQLKSQEAKFDAEAYQKRYDEVKRIEREIEILNDQKSDKNENIAVLNEKLKSKKTTEEKLTKAKKKRKALRITIKLHGVVSKAFSKQGIPMDLLRWFNAELEKIASNVYKKFGNGFITIEEVPGKQPGLIYYLVDASGKKHLNGLSKGQKMMVFVSLRVALTQLMQRISGVYVDYLILDEIVANLDEENRSTLMSLINGVLSQFYKQVIVVSHASMRNIFNKTVSVELGTDGVSRIVDPA